MFANLYEGIFFNLPREKMNILVLLVLIFKSKLLQYSFRISKYFCRSSGGIQPIILYHPRTSKYITLSTILDLLLDHGLAGPSPGFFLDLYKIVI